MSFYSVLAVEITKLFKKKSTLLLLLNFIIPLLYGIGAFAGASFIIVDDVEAVATGLSAMEFSVNMLGNVKYILFMTVIILAAVSFSGELENGQMKSAILRICSRTRILLAKYLSLLLFALVSLLLFIAWALVVYYTLFVHSAYASGLFSGEALADQLYYMLFTYIGMAVVSAFTILLGTKGRVFFSFALSYILWFASLYSDFFSGIKLYITYNWPDHIIETQDSAQAMPYACTFAGYCVALIIMSVIIFRRKDIKA